MTGNSAVITGNSAKTNGAGIYLESRSTLRLSGKPDFGGTGVKDDGSIDDTVGNFSAVTLAENAMNGGKDYTRSRQDIYLAGIGNPLASIVVTGAIDMKPGSVWVLCGMKQHYEMLKQFAVFESDAVKTAIQDAEKLESTMQVFRNAQTDLLSGCGAEYLTGKEGDDIGGRKCIYWNGGFDIAFQKINGNGEVLDGAQFKLYKTNEGGTKGDLAATATSGNVAKANAVTIRIKESGTVVDREIYGDGLVVLEKVSPGTYILEESVVPTGWKALEASYKVVVNPKGNIAISANDTEAGKARFVKGDDDKYTAPVGAIADDAETTEVYTILNISDQVRKPARFPVIVLTFAVIGGGIGSVLTFMLYGMGFGTGISAPLAHRICDQWGWSVFWSQFSADMLIDIADKTITVLAVALVLRFIPETVKGQFVYTDWHQTPLSHQTQYEAEHRATRGLSLRSKIILLVVTGMVFTAFVVTGISYVHFTNASIEEQKELARGVVQVVSGSFDHDRVDEYIEKGEAAEGYLESEAKLKQLMDSSKNVEFCYVYRILEDGCHVVFDPDTEDTPGGDPGEVVDFDDAFKKDLPTLLAGGEIEPVISNETYGWLLTVYEPVYDSQGVCQCYAAVDINMTHIANNGYQFLARVLSLFFGFFVLILVAAIWLAEYNVILPINTMSMTTDQFAFDSASVRAVALEKIKGLNILTGDEIENLYKAVVKTTGDMVEYIAQMQHQNEKISKLQNGLIMVLADMVESRDQCTGDHVRKTAAYTGIIMRQLRRDGIYTDQLTDAFMKDVENSAPLHDVGKIQVPDAILNKPGKLTDEEFDRMKMHTTAGREIITRAMNTVSEEDSSYLAEARNLAYYHHEKWNGRGYPRGLAGDEIPLSARIMAVADVFDALVSKRPYKDGFPFEKAMEIIRESSGSHFDPNVVNAFMEASDEVRAVMESNMGDS